MLRIRRVKFGPAKETDDLVRIMEQLNRGDEADNAKLVAQVVSTQYDHRLQTACRLPAGLRLVQIT